jgi:hypothetical protein
MFLAFLAVYFTVRVPAVEKKVATTARVDFIGAISLFIAIATPLFAINLGGNFLPWNHPVEIFLFCSTPFALAAFYYIESRLALFPIIPSAFIRMPRVIGVVACGFPVVFAYNQVLPTFLEYLRL